MRPPSLAGHLWLLWRLQLQIALNKSHHRGLGAALIVASALPALGIGASFYALLASKWVAESEVWPSFLLNLLCFVTSAVWFAWPIVSAGVDDHSEVSRYSAFPITRWRLLLASTVASVLESRILFFFAPVVGATFGYASTHRGAPGLVPLLLVSYAALNAAWSRAGLYLTLNVLKAHRNAELLGGFFAVFLLACSLIPPIDTSWLFAVRNGASALDLTALSRAATALGRVPPGFYGEALQALARGDVAGALVRLVGLWLFTAAGLLTASGLLSRFYRGPALGAEQRSQPGNPFARAKSAFGSLVVREALDLWKNPRARLLASVPFVLAILLKLLSGRALFVFLAGSTADAWLLGGLCCYAAVVIAATFSQNMYGYDGHGFRAMLAAPVQLRAAMRAKNVVHGGAALGLCALFVGFYAAYFRTASPLDVACALLAALAVIPSVLAAGNFLSVSFPVRFHTSLKRRDKVPFVASMLGLAAASIGCAPLVLSLRWRGALGPSNSTAATLFAFATLGWAAYGLTFPIAAQALGTHKERVLHAVTRD